MTCTDLLARFSDYMDGAVSDHQIAAIERHLGTCASCRRYAEVLQHGASVLRSLPAPEVHDDFEPRLRHRIYHLDVERTVVEHQSGAPTLTVLGIAVLLSAIAWAPLLRGRAPEVLLEPIVVDRAPRRAMPILQASFAFPATDDTTATDLDDGLWEHALLYEYSVLSQRYSQRAQLRRVSDRDP